ncbi:MAG TPA: hypothetical protein VGB11_01530 [Candidatus Bathyarchaeia archaeon]
MRRVLLLVLVALLAVAVFLPAVYFLNQAESDSASSDFFFGVSFGGDSVSQAKLLIDKVKRYTNLFVVNSWEINGAANETLLNEVCEYAINAGLSVMVYFNFVYYNYTWDLGNIYNASSWDLLGVSPWHIQWLNQAMEKWGNKYLGVYLYDEPGGTQIDLGYWDGTPMTGEPPTTFVNVTTHSQAAANYTASLRQSGSMKHITNTSIPDAVKSKVPVFTSDYALYWFDYLGGYDAVFVQLGGTAGDDSKIQQIALCRGAAAAQNKQWGAIFTWTYNEPPYLENAEDLLKDMTMAYQAGATYLIVFNHPYNSTDNPYGILSEAHFSAMEQFWSQTRNSPRDTSNGDQELVAFVLPKDYGWGMRNVADNIWGLWPADEKASLIWENMNRLIDKYGI